MFNVFNFFNKSKKTTVHLALLCPMFPCLAFKRASNSNFNVLVSYFQRGPKHQLYCVSTLLSERRSTTTEVFMHLAFKGTPITSVVCTFCAFKESHLHHQSANKEIFKPTSIPKEIVVEIFSKTF